MIVEQRAGDRGAELDVLRPGRHRAEPGPDEPGRGRVVHPGMEVVAAQDHVEAGFLGGYRLQHEVFGLVGLVAAQPGELHRASVRDSSSDPLIGRCLLRSVGTCRSRLLRASLVRGRRPGGYAPCTAGWLPLARTSPSV